MTDTIEELSRQLGAQFDLICEAVAKQYGLDPTTLSAEQKADIADEVEELTENWDGAEVGAVLDGGLVVNTDLQRLLERYQHINDDICARRDVAAR
jgi:hypothetical protein